MALYDYYQRRGYNIKVQRTTTTTTTTTTTLLRLFYYSYLLLCMKMVTSFTTSSTTAPLLLWRQMKHTILPSSSPSFSKQYHYLYRFTNSEQPYNHLHYYNHYNSRMGNCRLIQRQCKSDTTTTFTDSTHLKKDTVIPRAAVSVLVRHSQPLPNNTSSSSSMISYALVQRGKEPNKGMWSLPGGKIETGESTLEAAKRELWEETGLSKDSLDWCETGPITCSDSIIYDNDNTVVLFHYVISQCFAQTESQSPLPILTADDDAADAKWWKFKDIQKGIHDGIITPGVERVILRAEHMHQAGLLLQ